MQGGISALQLGAERPKLQRRVTVLLRLCCHVAMLPPVLPWHPNGITCHPPTPPLLPAAPPPALQADPPAAAQADADPAQLQRSTSDAAREPSPPGFESAAKKEHLSEAAALRQHRAEVRGLSFFLLILLVAWLALVWLRAGGPGAS